MMKMAMKMRARVAESERKTAAAAAEVAEVAAEAAAAAAAALVEPREPPAPRRPADAPKPPKSGAQEAPPGKLLTDRERKKLEKKLLEQQRKEEKKREKERKKLEKILKKKKKKKKVPEAQEDARGAGPEAAAAATAAAAAGEGAEEGAAGGGEGAGGGGTSRAWAQWDVGSDDEDDAYYAAPRVGGIVWRPGPLKAGALSAHLPLVVFLVFSVRSPSWVLNFLLQKRTEQGRGCGFVFGATCCFRMFLGCAFFSFLGGRNKRRSRGRPGATGAFGAGSGARRRGREERLI